LRKSSTRVIRSDFLDPLFLVGESSIIRVSGICLSFSGLLCGVVSLDCRGLDPHGLFGGGKRPGDLGPNGPDKSVDGSNRCKNGLAGAGSKFIAPCEAGDMEFDRSDPVGGLGVLDGFLL
jgi:hypothetical protein